MDDFKLNNTIDNLTELELSSSRGSYGLEQPHINNKMIIDNLCHKLGKFYTKVYTKNIAGFNYYDYANTHKFVCLLSRGLLMQVKERTFGMYKNKYINHATLRSKFMEIEGNVIMIIYEKNIFIPQVNIFQRCMNMLTGPFVMLDSVRSKIQMITSKASRIFFLDLFTMLLHLRDGYFTTTKIIAILMSVYTLHMRYMSIFFDDSEMVPQTGANVTDLLIGFTALGLPTAILDAIRMFTTLTGKRIFESDAFLEVGTKLFEAIIVIIKWIAEPLTGHKIFSDEHRDTLVGLVMKIGSSLFLHKEIKNICDIYSKYVSNGQCLFDPTFRQGIMDTYNRLVKDTAFMDYLTNGSNRYFQTTWNLFESNVVKSCRAFDTSGRDEPICFVFEGEAGSGKSVVMNRFVALLKESGMTTICHAVPAAEDGKDFYDDYENQDVFVMDDVGQQGKSQWRYLINYVSPVKYPLPCATASKKNTKFFNSKVILCTTNHFMDLGGFTSSDCISEPEALYRRAHVIKVSRGATGHFSQVFNYYKYDHIKSKLWENKFVNHLDVEVPLDVTPNFSTDGDVNNDTASMLTWLYKLFQHVVRAEKRNNNVVNVDPVLLRNILNDCDNTDPFLDAVEAQSFDFYRYVRNSIAPVSDTVVDYVTIFREFLNYYVVMLKDMFMSAAATISEQVIAMLPALTGGIDVVKRFVKDNAICVGVVSFALIGFLINWFSGDDELELPTPAFVAANLKRDFTMTKSVFFGPQAGAMEKDYEDWIKTVRKGCRTMVVRGENGEKDQHTQCVVSGKRILLPAHMDVGNKFVDFYQTWDHFSHKHVEIENVQLRLMKRYLVSDLAVYEIIGTVPLYKLNRSIFSGGATSSSNWFLINSSGYMDVKYDVDIKRNASVVSYSTVAGEYKHAIESGFFTPYSAMGGCGTVLAAPGAGILGFHVAGSTSLGFCVQPPQMVMEEIKELMITAPCATDFELDDKILDNFSGVRVRYERPVEQTRANGNTSFEPSILHVSVCEDMAKLITEVENSKEEFTTVPVDKIDVKGPPNFRAEGTPAKTLKHLSQKTFMPQGRITQDEVDFMKEYLRTIMVPFNDLTDAETAFGGDYVSALNKDSSNGYGCMRNKTDYFDFDEKIIKKEMYDLINDIKCDAENNVYNYDKFMCRETFKDELRKSNKRNTPRTFRVMPLGHIWWTKKIFGQLLKHFKETRMVTGISIGFNPYKDADELARLLLSCHVNGDADFGKWDGTIVAAIMRLIVSVMREYYQGEHNDVIEWLSNTISNSFVLVNDEIWSTTHGLPSGTWLTLMMNCLLNKCLTALVIFRYKPNPTVFDVNNVVDFVTGDDKVFGADKEMSKYFNLLNIKAVAESLGMDCTNGDKTIITKSSQPFEKLTYVKRHFRKHPVLKRYVGCLSLDTIFNTLQWINTETLDTHEAMVGKMRSMQIEAYLHSPNLFRSLTTIFENNFAFDLFFTEKKILSILDHDVGYDFVQKMQGKFYVY
jgi:hypothetical protein